MKTFETRGPVDAVRNYVVKRTTELADFIDRVKQGRYIVIFAPRQTGKKQFAAYMQLEEATEGYYVVFDHRKNPTSRTETETLNDFTIRSYVIPVVQEPPS
ncbi:hypothetical protein F4X10_07450 [Candidatus Poribacteria bacterium]|nr:hypothetical protein [Candidatus Poribacteria bacterium]